MGKKLLCYSIIMMFMCPVLMAEAKKSKNNSRSTMSSRPNGCDEAKSLLRELKCRRKGMRWHKDKCLKWKRIKRKANRSVTIVKTAPPAEEKKQCCQVVVVKENSEAKTPAMLPNINLSQKQMMVLGLAGSKKEVAKSQPAKKDKWWKIGGGFFVLGLWMNKPVDILLGPYASISSSLSKRLHLSSFIGYGFSPREEHYLLLGGNLGVRTIGNLWIIAGLDTIWAQFDGIEVNTRILLGNFGSDYWPVPWLKLGVRVNLGYKHQVIDCAGKLGNFVGGNMLSVSLHY